MLRPETGGSPSIVEFRRLSDFFKAYSAYRKLQQNDWSLRVMARKLKLQSPTILFMIQSGKRVPDATLMERLSSYFRFKDLEHRYFELLIAMEKPQKSKYTVQSLIQEKMNEIRRELGYDRIFSWKGGNQLTLEGSARIEAVAEFLKDYNLKPISYLGSAIVQLSVCRYETTEVGVFESGYLNLLCNERGHLGDRLHHFIDHAVIPSNTSQKIDNGLWRLPHFLGEVSLHRPNWSARVECRSGPRWSLEPGPFESTLSEQSVQGRLTMLNRSQLLPLYEVDFVAKGFLRPFGGNDRMNVEDHHFRDLLRRFEFKPQQWIALTSAESVFYPAPEHPTACSVTRGERHSERLSV